MNPNIDQQFMTTVTLAELNQGLQVTGTSLSTQSLTAVTYLTGPPGTPGATGATGPAGATGPQGIPGRNGTITGITFTDANGVKWSLGITTSGALVTQSPPVYNNTYGSAYGVVQYA